MSTNFKSSSFSLKLEKAFEPILIIFLILLNLYFFIKNKDKFIGVIELRRIEN